MPALPPNRPGCTTGRRGRPLPDPAAVRLCFIPDPAPPFDSGEPETGQAGGSQPGGGAGAGREERGRAAAGSVAAGGAAGAGAREEAGRPAGGGTLPAPGDGPGWPGRFAQALAETLSGSRHPRQIVPWTTAQARDHIQRLGPQLSSLEQPRVRRVVTFHPTTDAVEMSVVVGFGARVRALAVRLEREQRATSHPDLAAGGPRWLCTAVEAA
jgi:hypothetical protein